MAAWLRFQREGMAFKGGTVAWWQFQKEPTDCKGATAAWLQSDRENMASRMKKEGFG
ncbi:hypothetical protein LF41_1750 [Lysobacter dokdonensis DS-58]|uniref:Uncharacterized protein n=1 Tax=Lysobacter dokdonensis DS-58 TaxID=1300345 RepID=A0A0A2WCS3_9GAMM|nr:hypothetical protein LF41_1750 [Lysobacter dokdonensis DS-58]